jgi:hypothetical protein
MGVGNKDKCALAMFLSLKGLGFVIGGLFPYVVCGLLLHLPNLCKKWLVMHITIPYF